MTNNKDRQPKAQKRGRDSLLASASLLVKSSGLSAIALGLLVMSPQAALANEVPASTGETGTLSANEAGAVNANSSEAPKAGEAIAETVVVTARRRAENLDDVPLAVSAIGGRTLDVQRLDRLSDYAAKLPNFTAFQQNPRVSSLLIRGLGGNASSDGSESGVGLIVDNVFLSYVGFSWLDFVDLESVQIARGPQGTLLGKNTTIGAVIITTQKPSFKEQGTLSVTLGNDERRTVRANVSGPLIGDKLAGRLTLYADTSDGWIQNAATSDRYLNVNRYGIRGQLLFKGGESFENRLIIERYETEEWNNFYPPTVDVNTFANGAPRPNSWTNRLITRFGYTPSFDRRTNANLDTQEEIRQRIQGVSNEFSLDVGDHTLTSITAWRSFWFRPRNDSDSTPFPIYRAGYDVDVEQWSQELRLASPQGKNIEYQVGLYALRNDITSDLRLSFFRDGSKFFLGAAVPSVAIDGVTSSQLGKTLVNSVAGFGQLTWNINDRAILTSGLRYTKESREASNTATRSGGVDLVGPLAALAPARAAVAPIFAVADKVDGDSWSWLINPSYKVTDDALVYASISYGEKSGAANLGATPGQPVITKPEKSLSYEIGTRVSFLEGRAKLALNAYHNEIEGFQGNQQDPTAVTPRVFLANVGDIRLKGVEFEGSLDVTPSLRASFSGAYNDARYTNYRNAPPPVEFTYPGGPLSVDYTGKRLPNVPLWSGQLSLDYDRDIGPGTAVFAYINERWRSRTRQANPISNYLIQEAYGVLNAGVGVRWEDGKYTLQGWIKNALDEDYATGAGSPSGAAPGISILGDPRQYGLTLTVRSW